MTTTNRIVSIETPKAHRATHAVIAAVSTRPDASGAERRWTARAVLEAMNRAERFYTQASNGRRARVQRYSCPVCLEEHIRTHMSDKAIHDMTTLPRTVRSTRERGQLVPNDPADAALSL